MSLPLDEHQAPEKDPATPVQEYQPDEQERKVAKYVDGLFAKAKKAREAYDNRWTDYYHFFRGKQWKTRRPSYRHSEVINLVFTAIQNQVPLMTDARPRIEFVATEPSDTELAMILNEVVESDWERFAWSEVLLESLYNSHIYGTGLAIVGFDPEADYGLGAIVWESMEPAYGYPEPGATGINTKRRARHFIHAEPHNLDTIRALYPDKGKFVTSDIRDLWQGEKNNITDIAYRFVSGNRVEQEGSPSIEAANKDQALVVTLYCRPRDTEEVEKKSLKEDGSEEVLYETRLKYPNGRKIVKAGSIILEDAPLDCDGLIPVQKLINYLDPGSFWGISDVEQLEGPQTTFNKLVSFALDVLTLMGNPIWVVSSDSGLDTNEIFNIPGAIIEKEPGTEVRREEGVQLQPFVLQLIDRMKVWFDDISGSQEVSRGVNPSGVTAASAIESLQESGRTRIRQKTRNMDAFLQEFGRQYVNLALKNYTVPRVRRIQNKDGAEKYFKFSTERVDVGRGPQTIVNYTEMVKQPDGRYVEGKTVDRVLMGEFDVKVNTVSSLPFAKAERDQRSFQLYDRQVIDAEELLKNIDYPNAKAVLDRMAQRQQAAAQAQQQQQGAPQ